MFATAMDMHAAKHAGVTENGRPSVAKEGVGDARVAAFFKLVRGLSREALVEHLEAVLREEGGSAEAVVDAFVLGFSTRDVRGGKGERDLSRWWLVELSKRFPETVTKMLPLVPEYGSWRDLIGLLEETELDASVRAAALQLYVEQLQQDIEVAKPSLAGKWAPREGKEKKNKVVSELAHALFPEERLPKPLYRKALAAINRKLETVEVKMCEGQWAEIKPGAVPAGCLLKKRKAFMNLPTKGSKGTKRSEDADRIQCAENFRLHAEEARKNPGGAKSLHGRVLQPHEMVKEYLCSGYGRKAKQPEEDVIIEAQWLDLREKLRQELAAPAEGAEAAEGATGGLGKMVPLVDVSGSMSGTPMEVAIAMGLLISELGHPTTRNRFLTFESEPRWHKLNEEASLFDKVQSASRAPWGGSTDFSKAIKMLLEACVQGNVPPEEVGELQLVVLSDMQFNCAAGIGGYHYGYGQAPVRGWETQYEELVREFEQAGLKSKWKRAYPVPRVIFWNLRGDTRDYPASADTPGVDMVSGFSPNLLKLFLQGDLEEMLAEMVLVDEAGKEVAPAKPKVDPMVTVRKALDDARYTPVRRLCAEVGEGPMAGYVVPMEEDEVGKEGAEEEGFATPRGDEEEAEFVLV